jgi:uncharacterized protein YlxP (DUF503 family)
LGFAARHVGICSIELRLPGNRPLKGERRVVHSLCDRVKEKFNVSISEAKDNDYWQFLTLGVSCVSNDALQATAILSLVVEYIQLSRGDTEFLNYSFEMISGEWQEIIPRVFSNN